jgi:glycosyltransferase involved in cell wall biosynthesis
VQTPFLSLIIPAYNEQNRLPATLEQVVNFLEDQAYRSEVLIVNNNSTDGTGEIIQDYADRYPFLKGLFEAEPGKGAAVRYGMSQAQGDYLFMCDADLSMPIQELNRFLPPQLENFDIAIASREVPGAVRYQEPHIRHLGGRLLNLLIQLTILPGINDTQCGFKCFSRDTSEDLFSQQRLNGWSFDIELLFLARKRGYSIKEIGIPWYYHEESKVHAFRDALKISLDIFTIRRNFARGWYAPEN